MSDESPIRVVIADDTATSRELLRAILEDAGDLEVIGQARDGDEALALCRSLAPDLVVMDIRMPGVDGYEATRRIMHEVPTPIVIVSAAVAPQELESSLEASRAGALAVLPKPVAPSHERFDEESRRLVRTVRTMARVKVVKRWPRRDTTGQRAAPGLTAPVVAVSRIREPRIRPDHAAIAIATSTGGPAALHRLLSLLPEGFPAPILVVQHIAEGFVEGLTRWLDRATPLHVTVARDGERAVAGHVYVAPNGSHLTLTPARQLRLVDGAPLQGFRPSATNLFESLGTCCGSSAIAVVLTGMGDDGVRGLPAVRSAGGWVVAQNEATSVVYGMPAATVAAGLADEVLGLDAIAARLGALVGARQVPSAPIDSRAHGSR